MKRWVFLRVRAYACGPAGQWPGVAWQQYLSPGPEFSGRGDASCPDGPRAPWGYVPLLLIGAVLLVMGVRTTHDLD